MGLRKDKRAVKILDFVNDIRGTFVGWVNASHKLPAHKEEDGYQMLFYPHSDANKSWVYKFSTIFSKIAYKFLGEEAVNYTALKKTTTVYPRSAIEGFKGGVTFNQGLEDVGVPEYRVILHHDKDGNAPFADKYAPGSTETQEKVTQLKEDKRKLKQKLDAQDVKTDELEGMVEENETDKNESRSSRRHDPVGMPPSMEDEEIR